MKNIRFYTLLYIDLDEKRTLSMKQHSGKERISLFLKNAAVLDKSLITLNPALPHLTILTNNQALIHEIEKEIGYNFTTKEIEFTLDVPKGIPFYSAHFKIDCFRYFSSLPEDEYSVLVDNDIVVLEPLPQFFYDIAEQNIPMLYHLRLKDTARMMKDCRKIDASLNVIQWTGGEYWGGCRDFFAELYQICYEISGKYFSSIRNGFYHIGDEALTSIAVRRMQDNGLVYYNIHNFNLLYRFWGHHEANTLRSVNTVLAHLPADKAWVAKQKFHIAFDKDKFLAKYERHRRCYRFLNMVKRLVLR